MRRIWAYLALGAGVFFLVLAVLVRFVVAPAVVRAPLQIPEKYRTLIATGSDFNVLDAATGSVEAEDMYVTRHIQGDTTGGVRDGKEYQGGGGDVAVYEESLCLMKVTAQDPTPACANNANLVTASTDRVAFDRKSAAAVPAEEATKYAADVDGDQSIVHVGLSYKFPIDTEKRTYDFFDTVVGKAFPMEYSGTEKIHGVTVYRFVQQIDEQPCLTNRVLPSLYTNTRTVWVEPTTGVIVKGQEKIDQVLTGRESIDPSSPVVDEALVNVTALEGTLTFDDATQANQAQLAKDNLPKIHLLRLWLPLIAGILGLLLTAVGVLLFLRHPGDGDEGLDSDPTTPIPARSPGSSAEPAAGRPLSGGVTAEDRGPRE